MNIKSEKRRKERERTSYIINIIINIALIFRVRNEDVIGLDCTN